MEYCGGGSVADLMHASDAPLEQDMIAFICAETLAGLSYLHSIGKVAASPLAWCQSDCICPSTGKIPLLS